MLRCLVIKYYTGHDKPLHYCQRGGVQVLNKCLPQSTKVVYQVCFANSVLPVLRGWQFEAVKLSTMDVSTDVL